MARFFPDATPLRIPIKLSRTLAPEIDLPENQGEDCKRHEEANHNGRGHAPSEASASGSARAAYVADAVFCQNTVIEYGTPREVLFATDQPLEFADHVLVESHDGALHAEASVVAVQYHPKRTVVAARFLNPVPNWIVKS